MNKFFAATHIGQVWNFVSDEHDEAAWEGAGFTTVDGAPVADPRRNTVSTFSVEPVTTDDADLLMNAFGGDEGVAQDDVGAFLAWMLRSGVNANVASEVAEKAAQE